MIEINGVQKWFGAQHVLSGVNLTVQTGETLVILGRSGCGKSVLLKIIMGLLEADGGSIRIEGTELASLDAVRLQEVRLGLGMLFQGAALFDSLNVYENVGFALIEHTKMPEKEIQAVVREKLSLVGLFGVEEKMPAQLSGGMRKRVGLARAICNEPKIILYDEPTTGLDPVNSDVINNLILRMKKKLKVTSIIVTHDMTSAYKVADRIAMLHDGKIIGIGTPQEIRQSDQPVIRQFITGTADPEALLGGSLQA